MPLLTKSQKRTTISALRSSDVRAVDQKIQRTCSAVA